VPDLRNISQGDACLRSCDQHDFDYAPLNSSRLTFVQRAAVSISGVRIRSATDFFNITRGTNKRFGRLQRVPLNTTGQNHDRLVHSVKGRSQRLSDQQNYVRRGLVQTGTVLPSIPFRTRNVTWSQVVEGRGDDSPLTNTLIIGLLRASSIQQTIK